jgi:hypothetical protein
VDRAGNGTGEIKEQQHGIGYGNHAGWPIRIAPVALDAYGCEGCILRSSVGSYMQLQGTNRGLLVSFF